MRLHTLLLGSLVASLAAGCSINSHTAGLQDNLGTLSIDNSNALHSPYVAGSRFSISVQAGNGATFDGWTLSSSAPGVVQVGTPDGSSSNEFPVQAMAPGHATLVVRDKDGNALDSADVDVDVPTRIELCEQGLLLAGYSDDQAAVTSAQIVAGGTATFMARYFAGDQELYGNNALTATNTAVALASVVSTSFSARDFLAVTAASTGPTTVHVAAGGATLDLPVTAVGPSFVSGVSLLRQSENGASDGARLYVFARALDATGRDVYGSSFTWQANASTLPGNGNSNDPTDLLSYEYNSSGTETISAAADGQSASAVVHGAPATTSTTTSENTGCTIARGPGAPASAGAGLLVALGIAAAMRRRASR
jgi:hypothetical protein